MWAVMIAFGSGLQLPQCLTPSESLLSEWQLLSCPLTFNTQFWVNWSHAVRHLSEIIIISFGGQQKKERTGKRVASRFSSVKSAPNPDLCGGALERV